MIRSTGLFLLLALLLPAWALAHGGPYPFGPPPPPPPIPKTSRTDRSSQGTLRLQAVLGTDAWLHSGGAWEMQFHPRKPVLVTGGHGPGLRVWDLESGKEADGIRETEGTRLEFAWSPDASWMASGLLDGTVRILDAETLEERHRLGGFRELEAWPGINSLAVHPKGTHLVACAAYDEIRVWETATWTQVQFHEAHSMGIDVVRFAPDGSFFVTAADREVIAWDTETGEQRWMARGHTSFIEDLCFSPDGAQFATCAMDGTVRVHDAGDGSEETCFELGSRNLTVGSVDWSPDGKWIVAGDDEGFLHAFDAVERTLAWKRKGHWGNVRVVRFAPEGGYGASVGEHGAIRLWDPASPETWRNEQTRHGSTVNALAVTPDGERVISVSDDQSVRVWDAATDRLLHVLRGHEDDITCVAIAPDGMWALTGAECLEPTKNVLRWDLTDPGESTAPIEHDVLIYAVAITPDGRRMVTTGGRFLRLWNAAGGTPVWTARGHASFTTALAMDPLGRFVVSGNHDTTARIWSLETGACLHVLEGHDGPVEALAVSPDGTRLATGAGAWIRLWNLETGEPLREWRIRGRAGGRPGLGARRTRPLRDRPRGDAEVRKRGADAGRIASTYPPVPRVSSCTGESVWVGSEDGTIRRYRAL